MDNTWFQKADQMDLQFLVTPQIPTLVEGEPYVVTCIKSRIIEVIAAYQEHGIRIANIGIFTDLKTQQEARELNEVEGIKVTVVAFNKENLYGTFTVEVDSDNGIAVLLRPPLGIAYIEPVSAALWETRWTFQEIDRMPAEMAFNSANAICN